MKFKMPDAAAAGADQPKTVWGKLLASTPVVMTVVATLMAGLSNSEMTRAQYDRSLAAQQQSKVGDQWSFFQAKRLRGASLRASLGLLQATIDVGTLNGDTVKQLAAASLNAPNLNSAIECLIHGEPPAFTPQPVAGPEIAVALQAIAAGQSETNVLELLRPVSPSSLEVALRTAQNNSRAFDVITSPITQTVDQLDKVLATRLSEARETIRPTWRDFTAARLRYDAVRYDAEARYNRTVAELYELQVRQSNVSAARHNLRSQRFFFGMLGAQCAVILSSLALAVQRRSLIWTFAAIIGLAAVGFGIYVYLWI